MLLRHVDVVPAVSHDVPQSHHGVILVNHVVAVDRILTHPVAEAEEELHTFVRVYLHHVLARLLDGQGRRQSVACEDLVFLQVDMDWMGPVPGQVREDPLLRAVLRDREAELVAVHELAVYRPLPVQAVELERADDPRRRIGAGERVEAGVRCRIHAIVLNCLRTYLELQQQVSRSGWQDIREHGPASIAAFHLRAEMRRSERWRGHRTLSIDLQQPVLKVDGFAGKLAEVNNDVHAFRWADSHRTHFHRIRQEIPVIRDNPEWVDLIKIVQLCKEVGIEARRPGIEQAEPVAARYHLEERLDLAVHQELIADNSIQSEQVKRQQGTFGVIYLIGEDQGDIELREAGQMETRFFIAGVKFVEEAIKAYQPLVSVLRREVHAMIVVPQRAQSFVNISVGRIRRAESGQHVRVILVAVVPDTIKIAGVSVAFRWIVGIVKMGRYRRHSEAAVLRERRQRVDVARQLWRAVIRQVGRPGR